VSSVAVARPRTRSLSWRIHLRRPSPVMLCFLISLVAYEAAAFFVCFHGDTGALAGDGVSRVEIANRVLFSRDPHLAAIGFVWSPIPELSLLPLVALKPIFPVLVTGALAGNIMSAVFMAGAAAVLLGVLTDLGLGRGLRWTLTAAFALNPMIVLYAANSMSEAYFLFFLLLVVRNLHLWLRSRETGRLVATGFYLGFAYLTRYEAGAAAIAVTGVVGLASFTAASGGLRRRLRPACIDSAIALVPFLTAFVVWAITSWLITGVAFQQFTSQYGTEPQLKAKGLTPPSTLSQTLHLAEQGVHWMLALEPLLPLVVIACLVVVIRRRNWVALGGPAVLAGVLAFMLYVHMTLQVLPALRYYIAAIPLAILLIAITLSPRPAVTPTPTPVGTWPDGLTASANARSGAWRARLGGPLRIATVTVALLAMAVAIPSAGGALINPNIAGSVNGPAAQALVTFGPLTSAEKQAELTFVVDRQVSVYVDSLHLRPGSVLIDDFLGYVIEMASDDPTQYVITSDLDFQQILADPAANGVQYVLIPPPIGLGNLDAINRAYPGAYATGKGIGTLVRTFIDYSSKAINWRLYRVAT